MMGKTRRPTTTVLLCLLVSLCVVVGTGAPVSAMEPPPPFELGPIDPDILKELQGLGFNLDLLVDDPIVEDVNPNGGLTSGGTPVTITGLKFAGATAVMFGGTPAPAFTVDSDTQITVTAPAHAAGSVQVKVTTLKGSSPDTSADDFTYVAAPPTSAAPTTAPPTSVEAATTAPADTPGMTNSTLATEAGDNGLSGGWIAFIAVVAVVLLAAVGAMVYKMGKKSGKS